MPPTTAPDLRAAFLRDIIAHPDDSAPRLIFADWLEEQGGEQDVMLAEFIRVQCRVAEPFVCEWEAQDGMPCKEYNATKVKPYRVQSYCPTCAARVRLLARELRVFDGIGANPFGACFDGLSTVTIHPELFARDTSQPPCLFVRRGFVEGANLPVLAWIMNGKAMMRRTPLRVLRLTWGYPSSREESEYGIERIWRHLISDDEPGDNPVCRLHTLDLSRLAGRRRVLNAMMNQAYRPWHGLRRLILPNWSELVDTPARELYKGHEVEQWKQRVRTLETVEFGGPTTP